MSTTNQQKQQAAEAALDFIEYGSVIGVGTGSTVNFFIDALKKVKGKIDGAVPSSIETEKRLRALSIPIVDLNSESELPLYVDGADEITPRKQMIKGGGGALTREKIIAAVARKFVCIADENKVVDLLGEFPVAIEVIPMARSYVARQLLKLGCDSVYRQSFVTDNGNMILDAHNLKLLNPTEIEYKINNIVGVVCNGIFAARPADIALIGTSNGVTKL